MTSSFLDGFYVVYLFRSDKKGVYISLNQGFTAIENNKEIKDLKSELDRRASILRNNLSKIPLGYNESEIEDEKTGRSEARSIISKYYTLEELDNEEMLLYDLNTVMELYKQLIPVYKKEFVKKEIIVKDKPTNVDDNNNEISVWRIYPGSAAEREYLWPKFKEMGYIGIGWFGEKQKRSPL